MSKRYTGLPEPLKQEVYARDKYRCRWCGSTNQGVDLHHIEYRRGYSYDVAENLITLCRAHHSFVHGIPSPTKKTLTKPVAQLILKRLVATPGLTGSSVWRSLKRQWALEGRCEAHGEKKDECLDCRPAPTAACIECGNDDPCEGFLYCSDCLEAGAAD